jgi:hypothetical protein
MRNVVDNLFEMLKKSFKILLLKINLHVNLLLDIMSIVVFYQHDYWKVEGFKHKHVKVGNKSQLCSSWWL